MAGLPKLKPKTTSKRQVDSLSLKSCPEFSTMARTRHYTFSEGTSSSKEDDNTEGLYSFKTLEDHIQGCVSRFIESSRKSGALSPCKKVGNYYVGRQLGEGTFGKVKLGIHMLAGVKVRTYVCACNCKSMVCVCMHSCRRRHTLRREN